MSPVFGLDFLINTLDEKELIKLYNAWRKEYNLSNRGYFRQCDGIIVLRNGNNYVQLNGKLIEIKELKKYVKENVLQVHSW